MATTPLPVTVDFRGMKLEEQLAEVYAALQKILDVMERTSVSDAFMAEMSQIVAESTSKSNAAQALFQQVGQP